MTVERILKMKGPHVPTVRPEARISEIVTALGAEDTGALVVSTDGQHIDGIISERDVIRGLGRLGPDALELTARDLMASDVVTCIATDRVASVMAMMDDRRILHIPVVDEGRFIGIVSLRDINKLRITEVQSEADAMRAYITS